MSMSMDKRAYLGNNALNVNGNTVNVSPPPVHATSPRGIRADHMDRQGATADIAITVRGSDWYWTVCACMTTATFVFMGLATRKPRQQRIFHYITAAITLVASIAYFSMGANLGFTPIPVEYQRNNPVVRGTNREIYYVRYIDW